MKRVSLLFLSIVISSISIASDRIGFWDDNNRCVPFSATGLVPKNIERAIDLSESGNVLAAKSMFLGIVTKNPNNLMAIKAYIDLCLTEVELQNCRRFFEKMATDHPKSISLEYGRCLSFFRWFRNQPQYELKDKGDEYRHYLRRLIDLILSNKQKPEIVALYGSMSESVPNFSIQPLEEMANNPKNHFGFRVLLVRAYLKSFVMDGKKSGYSRHDCQQALYQVEALEKHNRECTYSEYLRGMVYALWGKTEMARKHLSLFVKQNKGEEWQRTKATKYLETESVTVFYRK